MASYVPASRRRHQQLRRHQSLESVHCLGPLWVRCMSSTRVTDRHRPLAPRPGQPVRELPDLLVTSPRAVRRSQLGLTRSLSSRSPVASRKPGDERAVLPGLRGSLIIPFPPARAATPAPQSRHAGPPRSRRGGRVRFSGPQRGRGAVPSSARPVCGLPGALAPGPDVRDLAQIPGGHPGDLREIAEIPGGTPDPARPPAAPATGTSPLTRALPGVRGGPLDGTKLQ